jgi:hypothetical protein
MFKLNFLFILLEFYIDVRLMIRFMWVSKIMIFCIVGGPFIVVGMDAPSECATIMRKRDAQREPQTTNQTRLSLSDNQ